MKRTIALSVIDQGVLSSQTVFLSFLLMRLGDAESVGRFGLSMAAFYICLAFQNSLVGTPLMTRVFGRPHEVQARLMRVVCTFDIYIIAASLVGTTVLLTAIGFQAIEVAAAVAVVVTGLVRELSRSISIATGDMRTCLGVDATAAFVSLAILWPLMQVTSAEIATLGSITVGNAAAILILSPPLHIVPGELLTAIRRYRPHFALTRWSLLSAVSLEVQNRAFLFIVEILRSITATGIIQVGRFLISPLSLVGTAWGRIAIPRMAAHFRNNAPARAFAIMWASMACLSAMAAVYFIVIYFAWDWLEHLLFQGKYPGLGYIVVGWCAVTIVSEPARCLGWVLQATHRFRELGLLVAANAIGVVVFMTLLAFPVPLYTALVVLAMGQVTIGAALLWRIVGQPQFREAMA